jgi:hypothetical protein
MRCGVWGMGYEENKNPNIKNFKIEECLVIWVAVFFSANLKFYSHGKY